MNSGTRPTPKPASAESNDDPAPNSTDDSTRSSWMGDTPVFGGIFYGAVAFVLSWIGVLALFASKVPNERLEPIFEIDYTQEFLAWLFYNAHTVKIVDGTVGESFTYFNSYQFTEVWQFHAIPAVMLFLGGFMLARKRSSIREGFSAGTAVCWGYSPLVLIGAYHFRITEAGATVGPEWQSTLTFAACLYPIAFGGLGGALVASLR